MCRTNIWRKMQKGQQTYGMWSYGGPTNNGDLKYQSRKHWHGLKSSWRSITTTWLRKLSWLHAKQNQKPWERFLLVSAGTVPTVVVAMIWKATVPPNGWHHRKWLQFGVAPWLKYHSLLWSKLHAPLDHHLLCNYDDVRHLFSKIYSWWFVCVAIKTVKTNLPQLISEQSPSSAIQIVLSFFAFVHGCRYKSYMLLTSSNLSPEFSRLSKIQEATRLDTNLTHPQCLPKWSPHVLWHQWRHVWLNEFFRCENSQVWCWSPAWLQWQRDSSARPVPWMHM